MNHIKAMQLPSSGEHHKGLPAISRQEHLPEVTSASATLPQGVNEASLNLPAGGLAGQQINVTTNHNQHLPFRDWLLRGILGSMGNAIAFPFRLIGQATSGIVMGVIGLIKIAAIIILLPTLIWLGILLQEKMQEQESVQDGAAEIVRQAGDVAEGVGQGLTE